MSIKLIIGLIGLIASNASPAQPSTSNLKGDYLGQKPPGMTPEIFAPRIISSPEYEHSAPAFSPDGKTVLWTLLYPQPRPALMMEMRLENGEWTSPAPAGFSDSTADDYYPSWSADGKKLYFSSRRKEPEGYPSARAIQLWVVEKMETGWGKPTLADTTAFHPELYSHSIARSGNVYASRRGMGGGMFDIDVYENKGDHFEQGKALPYNINSKGYEDGAFIAADESYLIFESGRPGGIDGSVDLYISFRRKDGGWSRARNMGPRVNSKFTERFARVSPDGKYLFFGSDRTPVPGTGGTDVYWVDARVIDELKDDAMSGKEGGIDRDGMGIMPAIYGNEHPQAIALLRDWMKAHPKDLFAAIDLVSALRSSGNYAEAEKEIQKMSPALREDNDLKVERAQIKFGLKQNAEAMKILSTIPATQAHWRKFDLLAGELYGRKMYKESIALYEIALKILPRAVDVYNMACCYALDGNKDKAFEALNKSIDMGYDSREQYEKDADLDSLKGDDRFKELSKRLVPAK